MKVVRYSTNNDTVRLGVLKDDSIFEFDTPDPPRSMKQLIVGWDRYHSLVSDRPVGTLESVRLLAPVKRPEKIICIGLNYADHAAETGATIPEIPVVFNKFPSTIIGPDDSIELPELSQQVDFEGELVVVIGKRCRHVTIEESLDHVFGYCCGQDVSARDWQKGRPGGQWLLGKTFDTFAPIGPSIVTRDEIGSPIELDIELRLNGTVMQHSNTRQLIFPIDFLVSHLSKFCTLVPGDLIFTGTPPGVGVARNPQVFLRPGDIVEIEIEKVGMLQNHVVSHRS